MKYIELKIPFTKNKFRVSKRKSITANNGNGYQFSAIEFSLITILGNGDDGTRSMEGIKQVLNKSIT